MPDSNRPNALLAVTLVAALALLAFAAYQLSAVRSDVTAIKDVILEPFSPIQSGHIRKPGSVGWTLNDEYAGPENGFVAETDDVLQYSLTQSDITDFSADSSQSNTPISEATIYIDNDRDGFDAAEDSVLTIRRNGDRLDWSLVRANVAVTLSPCGGSYAKCKKKGVPKAFFGALHLIEAKKLDGSAVADVEGIKFDFQ